MRPTLRPSLRRLGSAAVVGCLAGAVVAGPPAYAATDQVRRHGHCSGPADWQLEARTDDGRIEVRGEVDSQYGDRRWTWRILHDGGTSARGRATTDGGGFDVRRLLVNASGADHIGWRARNVRSGQTCRGGLTI